MNLSDLSSKNKAPNIFFMLLVIGAANYLFVSFCIRFFALALEHSFGHRFYLFVSILFLGCSFLVALALGNLFFKEGMFFKLIAFLVLYISLIFSTFIQILDVFSFNLNIENVIFRALTIIAFPIISIPFTIPSFIGFFYALRRRKKGLKILNKKIGEPIFISFLPEISVHLFWSFFL